ncbi:MAG: peptide chain release factor 1 [Francisellaceae bacterium]|jgi:peptide chain release factor 1
MKESIKRKLETLVERNEEISHLLSDPDVITNQNKFRDLSKEYAQLEPIINKFKEYQLVTEDIDSANEMLSSDEDELKRFAHDELLSAKSTLSICQKELELLLLPKDEDDDANVFLEIRAGTGGDEASIFSGDLYRMYARFAETQKWQMEIVNQSHGDHGGFKEIIIKIKGDQVYSRLKFESGAHRVQRVPLTESQGRVHTSACTVAIMPEVENIERIEINANDLKIDTFRASGAGGQHVNKTDSAIRITHLPTGVVVECQDQRSQHKNKASAMSVLQSRLLQAQRDKQHAEQAQTRKSLVGSGDRSDRIRTYNYPQGRVTDHRINLTLYRLDEIMEGDLSCVIDQLVREHQADLLSQMTDEN